MSSKVSYYEVDFGVENIEEDDECVYNIDEVQSFFRLHFQTKKLLKILLDVEGYEYAGIKDNLVDLSYMSGRTLLLFEEACIELWFYGDGMFTYRFYNKSPMLKKGYGPYKKHERLYVDMSNIFSLSYEGEVVKEILGFGTDEWFFSSPHFNENKAGVYAETFKLPSKLCFILSNGNTLYFQGDYIEYYYWGIRDDFQKD